MSKNPYKSIASEALVLQFSKNARAMRIANSLTKKTVAEHVGVSDKTVRRIEEVTSKALAKAYNPTFRTITKFASAAGVSVEEITTAQLTY